MSDPYNSPLSYPTPPKQTYVDDISQTQISEEVAQAISEPTTFSSATPPKKNSFNPKILIAVLAVVVLGGGTFATVNYITNQGVNSIAPNAPQSKPKAAEEVLPPSPKPVKKALCGNSTVEGSEECDDGNFRNGDGCSSACKKDVTLATPPATPVPPPTQVATISANFPEDAQSASTSTSIR